MESVEHIIGTESVIAALGYWPSFHDAEVIAFSAERALPFKRDETIAHLAVHVRQYESVGEGTAQYEQILRKSILVRLAFKGACDFDLSDFNHQNVINAITVSASGVSESAGLLVNIESIWGFGGSLRCQSVEVEKVEAVNDALST